jgi:hypothetical protein
MARGEFLDAKLAFAVVKVRSFLTWQDWANLNEPLGK